MVLNKQRIGLVSVALPTLSFASIAMADPAISGQSAMQASGGLTLGSAALVALAGAVVAFGKARAGATTIQSHTGIHGRLCTAVRQEISNDA